MVLAQPAQSLWEALCCLGGVQLSQFVHCVPKLEEARFGLYHAVYMQQDARHSNTLGTFQISATKGTEASCGYPGCHCCLKQPDRKGFCFFFLSLYFFFFI